MLNFFLTYDYLLLLSILIPSSWCFFCNNHNLGVVFSKVSLVSIVYLFSFAILSTFSYFIPYLSFGVAMCACFLFFLSFLANWLEDLRINAILNSVALLAVHTGFLDYTHKIAVFFLFHPHYKFRVIALNIVILSTCNCLPLLFIFFYWGVGFDFFYFHMFCIQCTLYTFNN